MIYENCMGFSFVIWMNVMEINIVNLISALSKKLERESLRILG